MQKKRKRQVKNKIRADCGTGFQPVKQQLSATRRNLPHWQYGGSTYFITFRSMIKLNADARSIALNTILFHNEERFTLWACVVMPDHVHLLLTPVEKEEGIWWSISRILHSIKSYSANEINNAVGREGSVWQDESFDRIMRSEEKFVEKWQYIRDNPVRWELCKTYDEWDGFYEFTGWKPVPQEE